MDNVVVERSVFWNAEWGNAMEIGFELLAPHVRNIVWRDCDIIRVETGAVFSIHNGDSGGGAKLAVREGDWKLVGGEEAAAQLFNLAADVGESQDLAAAKPDVLNRLRQAYDQWNKDNIAPLFESPKAKKPKAAKVPEKEKDRKRKP